MTGVDFESRAGHPWVMEEPLSMPDLVLAALGLAVAAAGGIALVWLGRPAPDRNSESIAATARALRKGQACGPRATASGSSPAWASHRLLPSGPRARKGKGVTDLPVQTRHTRAIERDSGAFPAS